MRARRGRSRYRAACPPAPCRSTPRPLRHRRLRLGRADPHQQRAAARRRHVRRGDADARRQRRQRRRVGGAVRACPTSFIGKIGRDRMGQLAQENLDARGRRRPPRRDRRPPHRLGRGVRRPHRRALDGVGPRRRLLPAAERAAARRDRPFAATCTSPRGRSSPIRRAPRPAARRGSRRSRAPRCRSTPVRSR